MTAYLEVVLREGSRYRRSVRVYQPLPNISPVQPDLANPVNLNGWHARWTFRVNEDDDAAVLVRDDALAGGITIDAPTGAVNLDLKAPEVDDLRLIMRTGYNTLALVPPSGANDTEIWAAGPVTILAGDPA